MTYYLWGALKEAHALSLGTKCKQFLFSVSLNPPVGESVRIEVFEKACEVIEERLGLKGQPRMIVFHEKEGRRHAHAVWSRIDADTMTAKPLPFFKTKLRDIRSEEHTSELQSLMRISYAVFCLKKKKTNKNT